MPIENLSGSLLLWYDSHARDLPWRSRATPYRVWISEIMLQQTRIEAARGYFERFVTALPDVESLAAAEEETVLKLWEGLGYYARARNLHRAAQIVMAEYGGELPADAALLKKLPGIGDYTAGAIASIAFGLPEPAVDGNVLRICTRLTCCPDSVGDPAVRKHFRDLLRAQYPTERCGDLTSAIMELGETVCIPGTPDCGLCPLAGMCEAFRAGTQTAYPVMPEKKERRVREMTVFLLVCGEKTALRKRPSGGLLAGLWEFPNVDGFVCTEDQALETARRWGCEPVSAAPCGQAVHIFTHLEWHMTGWRVACAGETDGFVWADAAQRRDTYAVPAAFRAFRQQIGRRKGETT